MITKSMTAMIALCVSQLAFGLNCTQCGDPVLDYRNYGNFFYNNTLGKNAPARLASPLPAYRGIVTNPSNGQYAEVSINRPWIPFTVFGVPTPLPSRELLITVEAPTGETSSYRVFSGSRNFPVLPSVKLEPVFDKTPKPQPPPAVWQSPYELMQDTSEDGDVLSVLADYPVR